jgi:flagellar basal-body rod protein FlgG
MEALDAARAGLLAHEQQVNVIANNLANMNTTGYKRVAVHFQDLLTTEAALDVLFQGGVAPTLGVRLDEIDRVFTPGALQTTGDPLDLAIGGDGFFSVRPDATSVAYTRDGSFRRDAAGFLMTSDGLLLEPPVQISGAAAEISVQRDGLVRVRRSDDSWEDAGRVLVTVFAQPGRLRALGRNLYEATAAAGTPQVETPGNGRAGMLLSQTLEASNVDLATELTTLIAAQRAYQFNLVAYQTADQMLQQLNEATQV